MQGKRYLSALLAALLLSGVLTSCAGGGNQDSKDTGTSAPPDSGAQTTGPETPDKTEENAQGEPFEKGSPLTPAKTLRAKTGIPYS